MFVSSTHLLFRLLKDTTLEFQRIFDQPSLGAASKRKRQPIEQLVQDGTRVAHWHSVKGERAVSMVEIDGEVFKPETFDLQAAMNGSVCFIMYFGLLESSSSIAFTYGYHRGDYSMKDYTSNEVQLTRWALAFVAANISFRSCRCHHSR